MATAQSGEVAHRAPSLSDEMVAVVNSEADDKFTGDDVKALCGILYILPVALSLA